MSRAFVSPVDRSVVVMESFLLSWGWGPRVQRQGCRSVDVAERRRPRGFWAVGCGWRVCEAPWEEFERGWGWVDIFWFGAELRSELMVLGSMEMKKRDLGVRL